MLCPKAKPSLLHKAVFLAPPSKVDSFKRFFETIELDADTAGMLTGSVHMAYQYSTRRLLVRLIPAHAMAAQDAPCLMRLRTLIANEEAEA